VVSTQWRHLPNSEYYHLLQLINFVYGVRNGKTTVLVIGAGIGGIATAARLARNGYQVTVLEKNQQAGGRCDRLVKQGHSFDTAATLFLMAEKIAHTFKDLGERMEDHLDLRRIDPTYRIYFDDGSTLDLTSNLNMMQNQLEAMEPGSFGSYLRYLNEGHVNYKYAVSHLAGRNYYSLLEYFSLTNLPLLLRLKAMTKHYDNIENYFSDPRLKAAFTFQDMYLGNSPYDAPATYSLLQYTEIVDGVWFPIGGMYRFVEALTTIGEKLGVHFIYNAPVEEITINNQRATGVTLTDGQQISADILVANADLPYVYRHLLPDESMADRIERKKFTCSSVMFYWGVDKQYPQLQPHNLFLAGNYRQSFDRVFKDLSLPDEPNFYVHAPARIDASMAPEGHDTLMVLVPVGRINDTASQDWSSIKQRARQIVLKRLADMGVRDLDEHIKFEMSFTPPDWKSRYNLAYGSGHGLSHVFTQIGYLRPRNRHDRYRNLYFVGASTHPGSGLPTVLISARLTTERVLRDTGVL